MQQLNLYSTTHCHLCEQAEALLVNLSIQHDIRWQIIEITEDDELLERYGLIIPVIKRLDNDTEIAWPFTSDEIREFISAERHT